MEPQEEQPLAGRRRLLSPSELLATRTRDHKVPHRSHGQKDFIPDGSEEQEERLRRCREEHWQLLEEERVARLGSLVKADWNPQECIAELKTPAGKFWQTMGFVEKGRQCLLPEEALYLLECGSILLFSKDLPLSVQEAYENLLTPKSVSLLKYQVFSHLKRLGYIVLRFSPSTVPTPYEKQLNLDSQHRERRHHKRKRSSSPRLQEDKKPKASEEFLECKESPRKIRKDHGSSTLADGSFRERKKASDSKTAIPEPVPPTLASTRCREFPSRTIERSSMTAGGNPNHVCRSRWDYSSIVFPNMGADCPQTFLLEPAKNLLPENVMARKIDAAHWLRKLNQKHERLTWKEKEQLRWENRYKSSVNDDKEVLRCSTWQEYKTLLKERRQWEEQNCPAHLWEQTVTPLVRPDQGLSTASVLQKLSVIQPSHILDEASRLRDNSRDMKIDFDVYQADAAAHFKKNNPGKPYVRMCVRRFDEQIPSLREVKQLTYQSGDVPVVFALVDNGDISFYSFKEFKLPVDIYP